MVITFKVWLTFECFSEVGTRPHFVREVRVDDDVLFRYSEIIKSLRTLFGSECYIVIENGVCK